MRKKNKVMLACAVAMVAVVVASTAVRCSVARTAADDAAQRHGQPAEQAGEPAKGDAPSGGSGQEAEGGLEEDILAALQGSVWQAPGDPQRTVAFRAGSFVESDGSSAAVASFDVVGAGEAGGQRYLDVEVVRDGSPAAQATTIVLEGAEGSLEVASDGFAAEKRYVQGRPAGEAVEVAGLCEPYTGLVDGRADELASAVSSWCSSHAPSASRADFDGEVYLDVKGGRVSATFHLDDAARTIVTVVYEGGAFSVAG